MKSRLLGGVAAAVLALLGAVLVFSYAAKADARAMAELTPTNVLVIRQAVPEGTSVADLGESVALEARPAGTVPAGALATLDEIAGQVTVTDLAPGEVLLSSRLVDPASLQTPGTVAVPKGLQEITFGLEPQRMVGGNITAGSTVGVFVSFDKEGLRDDAGVPASGRVFHKMLVTRLQRADATAEAAEGAQPLPAGTMLVSLAVTDREAAKIVYSAEYGRIWLTNEPKDAKENNPPQLMRQSEVYP
ncbi:Flp pilus assembly protein CpaB [Paeniglutamicibacter sp. ABSL32-1]|uniref:Flp pilus assembly protein CpaB n=1 Tax=Paeniglutamicibacter quisquiliarum TaxID=2849498 RepID=UPI001C2DC04A|nr:RcpC/CpaB family pilus assembly protein [Paeniglutamicibacter quisquiliarum]MBV1780035.1 Flp pilus assembly protein CpaB [Paeniglutamicibacter quisquiliarum]